MKTKLAYVCKDCDEDLDDADRAVAHELATGHEVTTGKVEVEE